MGKIDRRSFSDTEWAVVWEFIKAVRVNAVVEFEGLGGKMMDYDQLCPEQRKDSKNEYSRKARDLGKKIFKAVTDDECRLFPLDVLAYVIYPELKIQKVEGQNQRILTGEHKRMPAINPSSKKMQYLRTALKPYT